MKTKLGHSYRKYFNLIMWERFVLIYKDNRQF